MNWNDLFAALALVMVVEGLLPFINPESYKKNMAQMLKLSDSNLRMIGFGSMIFGLFFLYLIRS